MIEFFKEPNSDWRAKRKYFYALSALLLLAAGHRFSSRGGITTASIQGRHKVDVRFAQPPDYELGRKALSARSGDSEIQSRPTSARLAQVQRSATLRGQKDLSDEVAPDSSKAQVVCRVEHRIWPRRFHDSRAEIVGAKVGAELRGQAVFGTLYALGGMLVRYCLQIRWVFGGSSRGPGSFFHGTFDYCGIFFCCLMTFQPP